jgi:hypothetical protein
MAYVPTVSGLDSIQHINTRSEAALTETFSDPARVAQIGLFIQKMALLSSLIIDLNDDEVLYTAPDMEDDCVAAYWNMSCGYYKTAASCLRNALEIGVVGLFFMHTSRLGRSDYDLWDVGKRAAPNWGEMKMVFKGVQDFSDFDTTYSCNLVEDSHKFFKELCCYTHSKPYLSFGGPATNYMTLLGGSFPGFDLEHFKTLMELGDRTIELLAMMWLVGFPDILSWDKELGRDASRYYLLFKTILGRNAVDYAYVHASIRP